MVKRTSYFFYEARLQDSSGSLFTQRATSEREISSYLFHLTSFFSKMTSGIIKADRSFDRDQRFSFLPWGALKVFFIMICEVLGIRKMKYSGDLFHGQFRSFMQ
jgi:hypothetical protein